MSDRSVNFALVPSTLATAHRRPSLQRARIHPAATLGLLAAALLLGAPASLSAQGVLGAAQPFAVLGASTVTNTGTTVIVGDLGVYPGLAITGLASMTVSGSIHQGDAVARQAQADAAAAYTMLATRPVAQDLSGQDLGGRTLTPGVYFFASSAQLTGNLFLDFLGSAASSFTFQIGSTLTTASASTISVLNGGPGSSVFFQVGTSATLGTGSTFRGNILADQSITLTTGARIECGRAIALNGAVTLDGNAVNGDCGVAGGDFGSVGFSGAGAMTTVPEPTTFVLFGFGAAAMTLLRRRQQRAELSPV
jgi:hypothetical protein